MILLCCYYLGFRIYGLRDMTVVELLTISEGAVREIK